jgi:iron complex transport system substrate-binding protein
MKKIWQLGLTAFLAVFLLAACGGAATEDKPKVDGTPKEEVVKAEFPLTLTDAVGNEITI